MNNDTRETLESLRDWVEHTCALANRWGEFSEGQVAAYDTVWHEIQRRLRLNDNTEQDER